MSAPAELFLSNSPSTREIALWGGAAALVLAAHAAFALVFRDLEPFVALPEAAEQAMVVDLTPLPVTMPELVQTEMAEEEPVESLQPMQETAEAVQPEPEELAEAQPVEEAQPEPVETVQPEPETAQPDIVEAVEPEPITPEPEIAEPLTPEPEVVEEEIIEQEIVEALNPDVVMPIPEPRPEVKEPEKKVERKKPVEKKAEKKPVQKEAAKPRQVEKAKPAEAKTTEAKSKTRSSASQKSTASKAPTINPARWHSSVRAAVARRVGRVRGMRGTVNVSFVVSSSGAVVSAQVSRSSGNPRLDSAALGAVRSARVPAPPAGITGSSHNFSIPLSFR